MRISVFGLGYVGAVSCGCLAQMGHEVVGVDVSKAKVDMINLGQSPIIEPKIGAILQQEVRHRRLRATLSTDDAITHTDMSFISVGTPSLPNGRLDLSQIEAVSREIGKALRRKKSHHVVVVRSTMLPGSTRGVVIPAIEQESGRQVGIDVGCCVNPEFLREGSSVDDFFNPPKTVVGSDDAACAERVGEIYGTLPGDRIFVGLEVAEMAKYADNTFHAVKITFANEIGLVCKRLGIDSHEVMEILCRDHKLNLSAYYLKPGFAFGGSCLPKDVNALTYRARTLDVEVPMIASLLESNGMQVGEALKVITGFDKRRVGILGFSFKAGTDDLRGSPMVELIEALIGKGYRVRIYDKNVNLARLVGANKSYLEERVPHIAEVMRSTMEEVIEESDVVVIGNGDPEFVKALDTVARGKMVVDLVRIKRGLRSSDGYVGIAW